MDKRDNCLSNRLDCLLQDRGQENHLEDLPAEEADELNQLLKTATALTRYAETVKPDPEFKKRIESRLEEACELKYRPRETEMAGITKAVRCWATSGGIAAMMALLTLAVGFTMADAMTKNTTPGESLYPVKQATERIKTTFVPSESNKPLFVQSEIEVAPQESATSLGEAANSHQSAPLANISSEAQGNPDLPQSPPAQQFTVSDNATVAGKDNPGKSESAPGHQETVSKGGDTGGEDDSSNSSATANPPAEVLSDITPSDTVDDKTNPGKSESAPGHQPEKSDNSEKETKSNSGKK